MLDPKENGSGCLKDEDCLSEFCTYSFTCGDRYANGEKCGSDSDCQSSNCLMFECREEGETALENGAVCLKHENCKSGYCNYGYKCSDKYANGEGCASSFDCQSGNCLMFQCNEEDTLPNGSACLKHEDCSSSFCNYKFTCGEKYAIGNTCIVDYDCESNNCSWFICKDKSSEAVSVTLFSDELLKYNALNVEKEETQIAGSSFLRGQ